MLSLLTPLWTPVVETFMSRSAFRSSALSFWFIAILLLVGVNLANGTPATASTIAMVGMLAVVPPMLLIFVLREKQTAPVDAARYQAERRLAVAARLRTIERGSDIPPVAGS